MVSYVVVGGSRGIGLELVRQLSADAKNIVVALVRKKATSVFLNDLLQQRTNTYVLEADVADAAAMRAAAEETSKITGGGLDFLIHNAARMEAVNARKSFLEYPSDEELDAEFITCFRVNALGIIHSVNAFLPLLRQRSTKKILVMSTAGGDPNVILKINDDGLAAYGTTRASSNMIVAKYAAMLKGEGFLVVAFSPGVVDTSATSDDPAGMKEQKTNAVAYLRKTIPGYKLLSPREAVEKLLEQFYGMGAEGNGRLHRIDVYP